MEFLFTDSQDGTRLRIGRVNAQKPGSPEQDVLIVHGLAEHAGRYQHVAQALSLAGFRVSIVELRGHGQSGGRRGFVSRWSDYTADVRAAVALCPTQPVLVAHSMGGLVSLDAIREGVAVKKIALSNPLLGVAVKPPRLKVLAAGTLSRFWPTLALGNELSSDWLSRDKSVGAAYDKDPMVYKTLTPRWFTEMNGALERVHAARFSLPMALFYSLTDPITDARAAKALVERNGGMTKEYPGMLHEIFNEIGKEQVLADLCAWVAS